MGIRLGKRNDLAPTKKTSQLRLSRRTAYLGNDGSGHQRHGSRFETDTVLGPHAAIVSIGGNQDTRIIDNRPHGFDRRPRRPSSEIRRRAASSSFAVKAPCSASHSATPASPARTSSA